MGRARVVLRGWEIEDEVAIEKVIRFTTVYKVCCRRTASHVCREDNLLVQQTGFSAGQPTRSMHWAACGFGSFEVCAVYTVVELLGDLPPFPPPRPGRSIIQRCAQNTSPAQNVFVHILFISVNSISFRPVSDPIQIAMDGG